MKSTTTKAPSSGAVESLTTRTVAGAGWTSVGAISELVLHWVVFVVLARLLDPEDFGIYTLGAVVVGFSRVFAEVGLGPSLVQRRGLEDKHVSSAFAGTLILSSLTALMIAAAAPILANSLHNSNLTSVIRVLSLLFLIRGAALVARSLLQRELRFYELARAEIVSYLIGYGLMGIPLAYLGFGYWALVWAALVQASLESVQFLVMRPHTKLLRISWRAFKDLLSFGVGISVGRIGNYLALKGDYLVVGRFMGVAPLGIYSRAYELMAVPAGLFQQVTEKAFFSAVAVVQDDRERLSRGYVRALSVSALLLLPLGIVLFVLAPEIVSLVLGSKWHNVIDPLRVMALGMFFRSGYHVSAVVAKGTGDVHRLALRQWLYACLVFIAAWAGHFYGVVGVAVGVMLAITAQFVSLSHLAMRISRLSIRDFVQVHVPALMMSAIVLVTILAVAPIMRSIGAPPVLTLLLSLVVCVGTLMLVLRLIPSAIGVNGMWALGVLTRALPYERGGRLLQKVSGIPAAGNLHRSSENEFKFVGEEFLPPLPSESSKSL